MWVSSVTHQLTWDLGQVLAYTGIFEVFKHLLCAIHPNFLVLELRVHMSACLGQYRTYYEGTAYSERVATF